jgi:hypothetical protein
VESQGGVWTCGNNTQGQLGHSLLDAACPVPRRVESMAERHVVSASCAERYTALATSSPLASTQKSARIAVYLMGMQQGKVRSVALPMSAVHMQQLMQQGARVEVHAQNERTWVLLAGHVLVVEHTDAVAAAPPCAALVPSPSSSPPVANDRKRSLAPKALLLRCCMGRRIRGMSAPQNKGCPLAVTEEGEVLELVLSSSPAPKALSANKRSSKSMPPKGTPPKATPPSTPTGTPTGTPTATPTERESRGCAIPASPQLEGRSGSLSSEGGGASASSSPSSWPSGSPLDGRPGVRVYGAFKEQAHMEQDDFEVISSLCQSGLAPVEAAVQVEPCAHGQHWSRACIGHVRALVTCVHWSRACQYACTCLLYVAHARLGYMCACLPCLTMWQ